MSLYRIKNHTETIPSSIKAVINGEWCILKRSPKYDMCISDALAEHVNNEDFLLWVNDTYPEIVIEEMEGKEKERLMLEYELSFGFYAYLIPDGGFIYTRQLILEGDDNATFILPDWENIQV